MQLCFPPVGGDGRPQSERASPVTDPGPLAEPRGPSWRREGPCGARRRSSGNAVGAALRPPSRRMLVSRPAWRLFPQRWSRRWAKSSQLPVCSTPPEEGRTAGGWGGERRGEEAARSSPGSGPSPRLSRVKAPIPVNRRASRPAPARHLPAGCL